LGLCPGNKDFKKYLESLTYNWKFNGISQWKKGEFDFIKNFEESFEKKGRGTNLANQLKNNFSYSPDGAVAVTDEDKGTEEGEEEEREKQEEAYSWEEWQRIRKELVEQAKKTYNARQKAQAAQRATRAAKAAKVAKTVKSGLMAIKIGAGATIIGIIITIAIWLVQLIGRHMIGIKWIPPLSWWEWPLVILILLIVGLLLYVIFIILSFVVKMIVDPFDAIKELGSALGSLMEMFCDALGI